MCKTSKNDKLSIEVCLWREQHHKTHFYFNIISLLSSNVGDSGKTKS